MGKLQRRRSFCISMLPAVALVLFGPARVAQAELSETAESVYSRPPETGAPQEPLFLEVNRPVAREMTGGQAHAYRIRLEVGQYVRMDVEQREIDVAVAILDPDGRVIAEVDTPDEIEGPERISLVADRSGTYALQVRAVQNDAPAGRYEVSLAVSRTAALRDRKYVDAERAFAQGQLSMKRGSAENLASARQQFQDALAIWREIGEPARAADTLERIAQVYKDMGEAPKAIPLLEEALSLLRTSADRFAEAVCLSTLGSVYDDLGEKGKALEALAQAAHRFRDLGHRVKEAASLGGLGGVYDDLGEPDKALEHYGAALQVARDLREKNLEAVNLNNIARTYSSLGEKHKALDDYVQVLALTRELKNRRGEAIALSAIGIVYFFLGENERALTYIEQSLSIRREVGDRRGEGYLLGWIGFVYATMGDQRRALDYQQQSLPMLRTAGDRAREAITLRRIGEVYEAWGDKQKALDFFGQALVLHRAASDAVGEARTLHSIGRTSASLGQTERALDSLSQALAIERRVLDRTGEAMTLAEIARVERDRGNLVEARSRIEASLDVSEALRTQVADAELRASYLASVRNSYEFSVDLLMRLHRLEPSQGYEVSAFQASQRMRARSLLELLHEAGANVREGVDSELAGRERSFQRLLSAKLERLVRFSKGGADEERKAELSREIDQITTELDALKERIRTTSPRYAALTQPEPLTLTEIQRELGPDTILLEYSLGEEKSFLWAVTSNSLTAHELASRAEIESAARRTYELLIARNQRIRFETALARRARIRDADTAYVEAATALSRMLVGAVTDQLAEKRLLVVADGALQYVPFAALPIPDREGFVPFVVRHEIVNLPSASILAVLRREREERKEPPKILAVLADPVFASDDERVKASPGGEKGGPRRPTLTAVVPAATPVEERELIRSAGDMGLAEGQVLRIPRLPFTRREARAILALVPSGLRKEALDFNADLTTATSPELSQYRFVHFATHGFLNSLRPELSGLVLSLVDREGRERDGFLTTSEIFNLKLPANLVVLSGCRTGLGKEIKGEGLLGMTRGFMYAGAERVLVSLWDVSDEATADLMSRLYRQMLGSERTPPAAALRAAQISIWKETRWRAPYYWAGFILQSGPQ